MATPTLNAVPTTAYTIPVNTTITPLLGGRKWGGGVGSGVDLTYSFPSGTAYRHPDYSSSDEWSGWTALSAQERAASVSALAAWSAVSGITFTELPDTETTVGELRFAKSPAVQTAGSSAWAYFPGNYAAAGDVWLNPGYFTGTVAQPSYRYTVLLHEVGHALGLKHTFEAKGSIAGSVMAPELDSYHASVMSYNAYPQNRSVSASIYPTTPMPYDVAAIQHLYGANQSWRTGNDTYTFSGTGAYLETIWDAGGIDTIRYDSTTGGRIDLTPGAFSHLGRAVTYSNGASDPRTVAIAWGADIENAIGGRGGDTLVGNDLANRLSGGGGADVLQGGGGNDVLNGGGGADTMRGGTGNDRYVANHGGDAVIEAAGEGADRVLAAVTFTLPDQVENLTLIGVHAIGGTGNAARNVIVGNEAANAIAGLAGKDVLSGKGGDDVLTGGGGADRLTGGAGADRFCFGAPNEGGDTITDFGAGDLISLSAVGFGLTAGALDPALFVAKAGAQATLATQRLVFDTARGALWYDSDGTGAGTATKLCTLLGVSDLSAQQIVVA